VVVHVVADTVVGVDLRLAHSTELPDLCETRKEQNTATAAEVDTVEDKKPKETPNPRKKILFSIPVIYLGILLLSIHCDGVVAIPLSTLNKVLYLEYVTLIITEDSCQPSNVGRAEKWRNIQRSSC